MGTRDDRGVMIGNGLAWAARWGLRLGMIAVGGAVLWLLAARLWVAVLPVVLAVLLCTVLWPPTRWLRARRFPPALAAFTVLLGGSVVLVAVIALLASSFIAGVPEIAANAAQGLNQIRQWLAGPPFNLAQGQLDAALQGATTQLRERLTSIAGRVLTGFGAVASGLVTLLLTLVLAFLFLKDGPRFLPWLRGTVGPTVGAHLAEVSIRIWRALTGFINTQALVSLIDAVFIGIGLLVVGVPLAVPLAVLTFLGGFIPIVGALVAGILAVLVALVTNGFTSALIVLGIVVVVQQLEGNVLSPILQSRSLNLHAAVVLLAVTVGGSLFGIAGAFLAVPVAAAGAVVLRYLSERADAAASAGATPDATDAPVEPAGEPPAKPTEPSERTEPVVRAAARKPS